MTPLNKSDTKTFIFIDRAVDSYEQLAAGAVAETEVIILRPEPRWN